jgi:hypothetical protein
VASLAVGCRAILGIDDSAGSSADGGSEASGEGGAVDAGDAALPLVSVFCRDIKPAPGFCDDFDKDPFEKGWDNFGTSPDIGVGGGATLGLDTSQWKSAPRSVRMTMPQLLPGTNAESLLITEVPKGFAIVDISVDVRIDTENFPDQAGHVAIIGMAIDGYDPFVEIRRTKEGAYLRLDDMSEQPLLQPFPVGKWKTVEMRFTFAPDAGAVATYIDSVPAGGGNLQPGFYHADAYPRVIVGPSLAQGPIGEFRMNADNVVLRGSGTYGK